MSDHAALIEEFRKNLDPGPDYTVRYLPNSPIDYAVRLADALEAAEARNTEALANAWDEGFNLCAKWWGMHPESIGRDKHNPYRSTDG